MTLTGQTTQLRQKSDPQELRVHMPKSRRHIGIFSNSPEEISNRLFAGAQSYIKEAGGLIARDFCPQEQPTPNSMVRPPWQGHVDGVMICTGRDPGKNDKDMADWVLRGGVPSVVVGADWEDARIPRFHVDATSLAELAADHLVECGCRSFLYLGYAQSAGSPLRGKAFRETLVQKGQSLTECSINHRCLGTTADLAPMQEERELLALLRRLKKPLGIWTLNDRFAAAAYFLCQRLDLPIPRDVKLLGVDDTSQVRSHKLAISSIRSPSDLVARAATRALHRLMAGKPVSRKPTAIRATELFARVTTLGKIPVQVSITDAQDIIARHACSGLTVESLAQLLGVSKRTCELQFLAIAGCSPRDEIQRVRRERAEELLRDTLFSVTRIASMIGFAETAAFSKFFRNETGMAPTDFRDQS